MSKLNFKAIGLMVGMIFGAGIFALPYAFSQAGLFWGLIHFGLAFFILLSLHLLYSETAFLTKGKHRFVGYVELYLGKSAKQLAFLVTILAYYGSLLVYGLLGGDFLKNIFQGLGLADFEFPIFNGTFFSVLFFLIGGILILFSLKKIASINFYLTIPLLAFTVVLFFMALSFIKPENFLGNLNYNFSGAWFLPYGVWLFALDGFAVLPDVRALFNGEKEEFKNFKKVIIVSLVISAISYFIFTAGVFGVSGLNTSKDALAGLIPFLGTKGVLLGSLIGFLAVFTSFVALGNTVKNIFKYDYNVSEWLACVLSIFPPIILFFYGAVDFVKILEVIGVFGFGIVGIFTILMARRLRKNLDEGDDTKLIPLTRDIYIKPLNFIHVFVVLGLLTGVVVELWKIFV